MRFSGEDIRTGELFASIGDSVLSISLPVLASADMMQDVTGSTVKMASTRSGLVKTLVHMHVVRMTHTRDLKFRTLAVKLEGLSESTFIMWVEV